MALLRVFLSASERDPSAFSKLGALLLILTGLSLPFWGSHPTPPPAGKKVIRYLTYETGKQQQELVQEIVRRFEALNPDVQVQVEFNANARRKVYVELASGTAPDVFYAVTDDIPRLAARKTILNLQPLIDKEGIDLSGYFPKVVQALRYKGGLYAFPIHFSTDVLFYNKKLFQEAGLPFPNEQWTWNDYLRSAQALTRRDSQGRTQIFGTTLPDPTNMILMNGGRIFNQDYTRCVINNRQAEEALQILLDLRFKYRVAPTPQQLQDTSAMQLFQMGRVAMMPGRTYMVIDFNKQITDFEYDVTVMPPLKRREVRLAVGGNCISAQTKNLEAAWRFVKFYSSPQGGLALLGKEKNAVPAYSKIAWRPQYFLKPPPQNTRAFITSLKDAEILVPPIIGAVEYITRIRDPVFDQILRGALPIREGLKKIEEETNRLLKED